jgi:copper transport protein
VRARSVAVGAVVLAALALPTSALAHATLTHPSPAYQSRQNVAPRAVVLRFDQSVGIIPHTLEVFAADGRKVSGPPSFGSDHRSVRVALHDLVRAGYTVRWRVLSSDGHVGSGLYTFGYGVAAPPPTSAYGASGPTWADNFVRWAYFVCLALVLGSLGMRLLVVRGPIPERLSHWLHVVAGAGALAAVNVGILAFVLRAEDALQLPFVALMYGDLSPFATKTRFGIAFVAMTLGFAFVAALVFLSWVFERVALLWGAFAVSVGFASGLSLSGHSAVEPNAWWLSQLADYLHLVSASLWAGGLATLALVVWPLAPALRRTAFLGFSRLATVLIGVLIFAGTYLSILRLPAFSDLWSSSYGRTLLIKLAIVCVALLWGAVHHFVVRPRLERGEAPTGLRRSLLGESTIALTVLLVAAVLVNSAPPPRPAAGPTQAAPATR